MEPMIKTPNGLVPMSRAPKSRVVHYNRQTGQVKYGTEPIQYRPCPGCGVLTDCHDVNDESWCCECYVRKFDCPADWHPECVRVANETRGDRPIKLVTPTPPEDEQTPEALAVREHPHPHQMCELISEYWKATKNIDVTPQQIWNYSPTGELWNVFLWYDEALIWKESRP